MPDSVEPPAVPVNLEAAGKIQWKRFLRVGLPLSGLGSLSVVLFGPLGTLISQGIVAIAVGRYRRSHPGFLRGTQGALLGASIGFFSFLLLLIILVIQITVNPAQFHAQTVAMIQQTFANNPSPGAQRVAQWATDNFWGFVVSVVSLGFVITVVLSGITGALTASFSRRRYE